MKRLSILALLALAPAALAQEAGSVLFAAGDVTAERQPPEVLAKGDAVLVADTVVTGAASRAQLLMADNARISIRPNSQLVIDDYAYTPPAAATVTTNDDRSALTLLKGGFRTITGAIGDEADDEYEVRTAVGVLGIRGTDFAVLFCSGDCGAGIANGLYLTVFDGIIDFTTPIETIVLNAGESAFIPLETPRPRQLPEPPAFMLDDNDFAIDGESAKLGAGDRAGDDDRSDDGSSSAPDPATSGFNSSISTRRAAAPTGDPESGENPDEDPAGSGAPDPARLPTIGIDADGTPVDITPGEPPQPTDPRTIAFSGGPLGTLDQTFNGTLDNAPGEYFLDPGNNVLRFNAAIAASRGLPGVATFDIDSAQMTDTGFDSMTVLRWGRWSGGTMRWTTNDDGQITTEQVSLANQSVHWISGPAGAPPVMPITGTALYSLVGSTSPTDNQGNVGVLGAASFQADFTNMLVTSTLDLTINAINWTASGNGTIGGQAGLPPHMFQGNYNNVLIGGSATGSGLFSGFFSAPGPVSDPSFPGGVGLTFTLADPSSGQLVSGSAAFGNP